jgi:hydroxymethylglutaryl-CoA synthase
MSGIKSIGSYLPKFRMQRSVIAEQLAWFDKNLRGQAKGARCVANWDEDAITMAVAAARKALANIEEPVSQLIFASTTAPFLDRSNATLISEALSLDGLSTSFESSGSQRAASSVLLSTLESGAAHNTLIVAADRRSALPGSTAEMRLGDASSALVVGLDDGIANYLGGASVASDFIDHYRTNERVTDYSLEDRWVRDEGVSQLVPQAIRLAATKAKCELSQIDRLVLPLPAHHAKAVIKSLELTEGILADNLFADIGDSGVGHFMLMLDQALQNSVAGQIICVTGFGQGCDAMLFMVGDTAPNKASSNIASRSLNHDTPLEQAANTSMLDDYLKLPAFSRQLTLASGIRGEADKRTSISAYYRHHRAINSMLGSACEACATPHFPPARVCVNCQAIDQMQDYPFANKLASVKSFTEDWQTATPSPPMVYGNVEFEGGGNAFMELSDVTPGTLAVGAKLKMQFRIKDYDDARGFRRYFWKPVITEISGTNHDAGEQMSENNSG